MSLSLKSLIPVLAYVLKIFPAALYERQRALVRAGLLQARPGRGPGSGVRATPESVALLLISLIATGSLSEVERKTKVVAALRSRTKRCPLTGEKTFVNALTAAFRSEEIGKRISLLFVVRAGEESDATIVFDEKPNREIESKFGKGKADLQPFYVVAYLHFVLFAEVGRELRETK